MSHRQPIRSIVIGILGAWLFLTGVTRADWQLSAPGDPSRQWDVSLKSGVGYDDNFNTAPNDKQGSLAEDEQAIVDVKLPPGQTSGELRYTYEAVFYSDRPATRPDQSNILDANLSHSFTPRLTASLSDSFRQGLEPALVGGIITRERGDYTYNQVSASLSYQLTTRWTLSLNQSWDRWWFVEQDQAVVNNRDDYGTTASAIYALDSRSTIGGNYSYGRTSYSFSTVTNSVRDSNSQSLYASYSHLFKPLVSLQAAAGAQLTGFGGSAYDPSPYLSLGLTYTFRANDTLSLGATYNIQVSEVAQFRSSDDLAMYLNLMHRFTPKFYTTLTFNYTIASFRNLNPLFNNPYDLTQKSSVDEDSWVVDAGLNYDFTPWAGAYVAYIHSQVVSGFDNQITGFLRSFDRNQYNVGLKLTY